MTLTLTAVTVRPALVLPMPVVSTDLGVILEAYFRNCDFPVPASTTIPHVCITSLADLYDTPKTKTDLMDKISASGLWVRTPHRSQPCFLIWHQYWLVPGSGLDI